MRHRTYRGLAATVAVALVIPLVSAVPASAGPEPGKFANSAALPLVKRHLQKLQEIADANGGTRSSGTPGYDRSVDYVADKLRGAGYQVTLQQFEFPFFRELERPGLSRVYPNPKTYVEDADFLTMEFSGSGDVTGTIQGVDLVLPPTPVPSSTSGCESSDFAGFISGNVALLQRGTCDYRDKVSNAKAAGASAVIIFNEGQPGRDGVLFGSVSVPADIPVVGTAFAVGQELAAAGTVARVQTATEGDPQRVTHNVIADHPFGDPDKVVALGAHLDSDIAGPGIQDNGSGVGAVLEAALQLASQRTTNLGLS
ncbi:PA domain-containing protein [Catellatospora aurea]|uniref:PA domain-containing protein n=1 Tax=Catellatospora aurea TaxID=1337874 RepID=A0ABW2H6A0_9ACTN